MNMREELMKQIEKINDEEFLSFLLNLIINYKKTS